MLHLVVVFEVRVLPSPHTGAYVSKMLTSIMASNDMHVSGKIVWKFHRLCTVNYVVSGTPPTSIPVADAVCIHSFKSCCGLT